MTKQSVLMLLLLAPVLAYATSQQMYWNHIAWTNLCQGDVEVEVIDYTNVSQEPLSRKQLVSQGEAVDVGLFMAGPQNAGGDQLSPGYKLVLRQAGGVVELGRQKMQDVLANIPPHSQGTSRDWVIRDPALCPRS